MTATQDACDPRDATVLYKILYPSDWEQLPKDPQQEWKGVGIDLQDSFIHFSTLPQLAGTLQRFFSSSASPPRASDDTNTLYLSLVPRSYVQAGQIDPDQFRFDPAAGTVFPHIYGGFQPARDFADHVKITRDQQTGEFVLPASLQF